MRRIFFTVLVFCSGFWVACEVYTPPLETDGLIQPSRYHDPTAPESLVFNLTVSYRQREIREYAKLLAPEFVFKLQPIDAQQIGKEFLTRDEDSTGTARFFCSSQVSAIRLELLHGPAESTGDPTFPPGTLKIRINQTDLQVDQVDGLTWSVADIQDMFFRKGLAGAGEDTTRWFLLEWRDLASPGKPVSLEATTWGKLKTQYEPCP